MKGIENQSYLASPVPASSRVNPLPQVQLHLEDLANPVGAGSPAKRPVQAIEVLNCWPCTLMHIPMAYKPSPAQPPSALLRQVRPLRLLLNQAERLEHLQRLLESQLQPAAREHCHVASWRDGTLLLVVTDGHWATRLRYQQKRLLAALQGMEAFGNLRRILYKVQPPLVPAKRGGHAAELSNSAAESLRDTAEGITDPKLRAALERLATHAQDKK